jgi:hypothetical protein
MRGVEERAVKIGLFSLHPRSLGLFLCRRGFNRHPRAMQNPGFLVTVKAAIKPPGFKVFLLNEAKIAMGIGSISSSQFGSTSAALPRQGVEQHLTDSFNQIAF